MRPFRNPRTLEEVEQNFAYLAELALLPVDARVARDPDWGTNAAWQFDEERFLLDAPYREVAWPEVRRRGLPRLERERERERGDIDDNAGMLRLNKLNLDKLAPGPEIVWDFKLPPFKVEYDTHEQLHQKLNNTVIVVRNLPFLVTQTARRDGRFWLYLRNTEQEGVVAYDDIKDVRGIAPSYWMYRGTTYWVYRSPERQNSQGMCQRNTYSKQVGQNTILAARTDFLLEALHRAKDMTYAPNLLDVLTAGGGRSLRLTNRVALYLSGKKGAPLGVEYCGRAMGLIVNNACKVLDPLDLGPSWIRKDLAYAGLDMRE